MSDYNAYPAGYFLGSVETFEFIATSDVAENSIVTAGSLIGVTRQSVSSGKTGVAFLSGRMSHYNIELIAVASAVIPQGTAIYITTDGKATTTATGNTLIGCLYQAVAVGDTFADVLLYPPLPTSSS